MSKCGTYQGYKDHIKNGSETCINCRAANAMYMRRYRYQTGAVKGRIIPIQMARTIVSDSEVL